MWLADLARIEGDYARAAALHRESLILYADAKRSDAIAISLELVAWLATAQEAGIRAARLFGAADALFEATGQQMDPMERAEHEQNESLARVQLGAAEFAAAWAEGRAMTMDQAIAYALESDSIKRG
jgi:non-specific serine/threonine protein kinase